MLQIETTRFGRLRVRKDSLLRFPEGEGLYGFRDCRNFVLIDLGDGYDFHWLQSAERPELAFLVTDPTGFVSGYEEPTRRAAGMDSGEFQHHQLLALVHVDRCSKRVGMNLLAPLLVHRETRGARQLVLSEQSYGPDHDLVVEYRRSIGRMTVNKEDNIRGKRQC